MDIRDYDALVATVRRRLPELTPAQLTDLGIAVRAEQERRQWPLTSATPLQSGAAAVTVGVAPHISIISIITSIIIIVINIISGTAALGTATSRARTPAVRTLLGRLLVRVE